MLISLQLTNFKKHENLEVNFSQGLVALRGLNEAGKSSLLQAVAYALYGSRALPMSLEKTVTYGKPESTLKVSLKFAHEGVIYEVTRSKSGALLSGTGVTANGQSEVTRFVENLLRVPADVALNIMLAKQGHLRGALEGGGNAVALIESMSNMGLLDSLITGIQSKLPSGNTKLVAARVESLSEVVQPMQDFTELQERVAELTAEEVLLEVQAGLAAESLRHSDDSEARRTLVLAAESESRVKKLKLELQALESAAESFIAFQPSCIENLEQLKSEQVYIKNVAIAWQAFNAINHTFTPVFDENRQEIQQFLATCTTQAKAATAKISQLKQEAAVAVAKKIKEQTCAFCDKDLKDVPEVIQFNVLLDAEVVKLTGEVKTWQSELAELDELIAAYTAALAQDTKSSQVLERYPAFVEYEDTTPKTLNWIGGVAVAPSAVDYDAQIQAEKQRVQRQTLLVQQQVAAQAKVEHVRGSLLAEQTLTFDVEAAHLQIQETERLARHAKSAQEALNAAALKRVKADAALSGARREFKLLYEAYQASQVALREAKLELEAMQKHNSLILKLREARPVIAKRLWDRVLAAASRYFSTVRGVPSVVTRTTDGFQVDGYPIAALSGSTLDSLGLAVRVALQKTFLPTLGWLILDEPAAGMDEAREAAMLGLLASIGYDQVLVVTHSELADTFAAQVVTL